jgi:hypothetical protein
MLTLIVLMNLFVGKYVENFSFTSYSLLLALASEVVLLLFIANWKKYDFILFLRCLKICTVCKLHCKEVDGPRFFPALLFVGRTRAGESSGKLGCGLSPHPILIYLFFKSFS